MSTATETEKPERGLGTVLDTILKLIPADVAKEHGCAAQFNSLTDSAFYAAPEAKGAVWASAERFLVDITGVDPTDKDKNPQWVLDVFGVWSGKNDA